MTFGIGKNRYDHTEIEPRWQDAWDEADVFRLPDDAEDPAYVLAMFPYASGELHMGHVRNYTITDAFARFERMRGENVLHPMGWDSFGLPAENAAEERDTNPREWTMDCIDAMTDQLGSMGFGYDWEREITTCEPGYYRWNQWLFKRFRDAGLVERQASEVNWCGSCETVLADEQVETEEAPAASHDCEPAEVCWRCDSPVETREMDQWFFAITEYADELLDALDELEGWPASVREMQRNWIGRQTGASVEFDLTTGDAVEIFTTRLDTIYGATYLALSPGHPVARRLADQNEAVAEYVERVDAADEDEVDETSGVFTGASATNPATGEEIPVYVADYVLDDVGTGALYAVPAHDERDHAFARAHDVPIRQVVEPAPDVDPDEVDVQEAAYTADGVLVDSGEYDGLTSERARERLVEDLDGERRTEYRLRDWGISRQRYWGTPIPMIECEDCGYVEVPDEDLPVELPAFVHTAGNPLDAAEEWKRVDCPECGDPAERETDTMDTFVDSSWYFLRFLSPDLAEAPFDAERATDWLPVDRYVGGVEHATMHLIYARFFTKVLDDLGLVDGVREPFRDLTNQGMVLGEDGRKMSKSLGNGISPERIVEEYGAGTARLFIMEAAQPEKDFPWDPEGVESAHDFLQNLYGLAVTAVDAATGQGGRTDRTPVDEYVNREIAATAAAATAEYEEFRFNHALQATRELVSLLRRYRDHTDPAPGVFERGVETATKLLAPVAPHVAEEVWAELGHDGLIAEADWPAADPPEPYEVERRLVEDTHEDVRDIVEVAGIDDPERVRIAVAPDWKHEIHDLARESDAEDLVRAVMTDERFQGYGEAAADVAKELAAERAVLTETLSPEREHRVLKRAAWLVEREFDAAVEVVPAAEADEWAADARPGRPAIRIE